MEKRRFDALLGMQGLKTPSKSELGPQVYQLLECTKSTNEGLSELAGSIKDVYDILGRLERRIDVNEMRRLDTV